LKPTGDDLEALANAVREAARPRYTPDADPHPAVPNGSVEVARRGHLRMLTSVDDLPAEVPAEAAPASRQGEFFEDFDGIDFDDDQDFDPR
jgi:hypothetical protein